MRLGQAVVRAALVVALVGCADSGPSFAINVAPGFKKDGRSISVFGVFRDGRMSPESWDTLAPKFSGVLHENPCEAAIGMELQASLSPVFAAVDDVARSDGITEALLERFAPAAKGDSILVIVMSGRVSKPKGEAQAVSQTTTTAAQMGRGGMGGGMGGRGRGNGGFSRPTPTKHEPPKNALEISASLYSTKTHQSVAMIAMTYAGESEAEAVELFAAKVAQAFPSATCGGWQKDLGVDPDTIRATRAP